MNLPDTMRAVVLTGHGGLNQLVRHNALRQSGRGNMKISRRHIYHQTLPCARGHGKPFIDRHSNNSETTGTQSTYE